MLTLQSVTYAHPNKDVLFSDLTITINKQDKIALVGNNGAGKSTLLNIMAGNLHPLSGTVTASSTPYYVPQIFGQYNHLSIAEALKVDKKLSALHAIMEGDVSPGLYDDLNDDWGIEERCQAALMHWDLAGIDLQQPLQQLSGGQKTKVFLAGIDIHQPEIVLMDEPSNHLDASSRAILYDYIQFAKQTLVVVSHDRVLLQLLNTVCELSKNGITTYGGNYTFYQSQKAIAAEALENDVRSAEKAFRKAKETEREAMERQAKLDARGKKKQEKAGLPTISMNTFRNSAEKSTARMKGVHADKIDNIRQDLQDLRKELPALDTMKMGFDQSQLHKGKILFHATNINFTYNAGKVWKQDLSFILKSGQRVAIKGNNGSGKTTLIKVLLGQLAPTSGQLTRAAFSAIYIDQDYALINNSLTVYQQAQQFNPGALQEHEIKTKLTRFLFLQPDWDKPCSALSGGEKMRLVLCCLTINNKALDMIILDEPTNNLDIQNIEILTAAINEYEGTLIVVSHDQQFLADVGIEEEILL
ncbi:ATPase subunit of ABC transporter with duplicated ATPase domains [Chitinophaga skermanii]|uniref:ATPase subunit of ABC transporter with duplicated ATPase domains n=1 Tax=Chitinophaga skermanii TaxID=331697 RepID=A0A327QYM0_9BACT|nr:ABC-F family ATP-binding cassette domain-containing protein [Chitinophaga skermanii]RAJ08858.1 ATPase subunit of ABC transporter with duplicated ATPase domains [Chitinophaga skermanii]